MSASNSGAPEPNGAKPNNAGLDADGGAKSNDGARDFVRPNSSSLFEQSQLRDSILRSSIVPEHTSPRIIGVTFRPDSAAPVGPSGKPNSSEAARRRSPDDYKRSTSSSTKQRLKRVPEEMESTVAGPASYETDTRQYYGSVAQGKMPQRNALSVGGATYNDNTLLSYDEDSDISEEEEEWILDEELAKQGLYRGNMKKLYLLYTLVPLSAGLAFIFLALIPVFVLPNKTPSPYPYPPYLPYPFPEVLTATALWSLSYLLRDFLYGASLFVTSWAFQRLPAVVPILTTVISAVLQSASTLFFRQLAIPLLLVPYYSTHPTDTPHGANYFIENIFHQKKHHYPTWQDDAFRRVWWIALGWAATEAVVGIKQGYDSIALYRDVLVNVSKHSNRVGLMSETPLAGRSPVPRTLTPNNRLEPMEDTDATPTQRIWNHTALSTEQIARGHSDSLSSLSNSRRGSQNDVLEGMSTSQILGETRPLLSQSTTFRYDHESERIIAENEIERDLDQLAALKSREDLEEIYGIPFIRIPAFISCLHRINSILVSLGSCLLLTSAYMRSAYSYHPQVPPPSSVLVNSLYHPSNKALAITAPILLLIHTVLTVMHTPWVLPRIGVQSFVYVTLLVSLLLLFGGLGIWEALS